MNNPSQQKASQLRQKKEPRNDTMISLLETAQKLIAAQSASYLVTLARTISQEFCNLLTDVDHVALLLRTEPDDERLTLREEYTTDQQERELILSSTVLNAALKRGKQFFSDDVANDERLASADSIIDIDVTAVAATPLIGQSGIIGVLYTASFGEHTPAYFRSATLQAFANLAAAAVENFWVQQRDQKLISHRLDVVARLKRPPTEADILAHGLGGYLLYLREQRGYTQREVGERSGWLIDKTWLSRIERGDAGPPRDHVLRLLSLAEIYKVPHETIFLLAGLEINLPDVAELTEGASPWLTDILHDPLVMENLHKLSQLPPKARGKALTMLEVACDLLAEKDEDADADEDEAEISEE